MKKLMMTLSLMAGLLGLMSAPAMAAEEAGGTDYYQSICADDAIDEDLKVQAGCQETRQLSNVVVGGINAVIAVIGLVAVVVIVYGGIQYSTSLGDPGKITQARNTIIYGVIGLVVGMLAWVIVQFITASVQPYDVTGGNSSSQEDDD